MPRTFDNNNNHGTKCAGAAAAAANNEVCGVGVAFNANIGGIRLLDGQITDLLEARSLLYKMNETDIKTLSWGPMDDGTRMEHPHKFVNQALEDGVAHGRNGKGALYVWASGNGGARGDDCTCDGYVSNWNVISIGSINHHGMSTFYSEVCPSTFAVVYSGGKTKNGVDEDDPGVRVTTSDVRGKCSQNFQGTSAAAPVAAGVFALVLEANPDLTYRDVMHLVARTSKIPNKEDLKGWIINGGGYHVNEKYGFGVLDASQLIQEAQGWTNVPPRHKCTMNSNKQLEFDNQGIYEIDLVVSNECPDIDFLEHTVANISFSYPIRGEMQLTIISPSGTPSELLSYRPHDESTIGTEFFPFMTTHNWGESPLGKWRLIIEPKASDIELKGSIDYFSINFYGFKLTTSKISSKRSHGLSKSYKPSSTHIRNIYDHEFEQSRASKIVHKRVLESDPALREALKRENN